jgi:hypothetical protein
MKAKYGRYVHGFREMDNPPIPVRSERTRLAESDPKPENYCILAPMMGDVQGSTPHPELTSLVDEN